jgi:hypothetical protein
VHYLNGTGGDTTPCRVQAWAAVELRNIKSTENCSGLWEIMRKKTAETRAISLLLLLLLLLLPPLPPTPPLIIIIIIMFYGNPHLLLSV